MNKRSYQPFYLNLLEVSRVTGSINANTPPIKSQKWNCHLLNTSVINLDDQSKPIPSLTSVFQNDRIETKDGHVLLSSHAVTVQSACPPLILGCGKLSMQNESQRRMHDWCSRIRMPDLAFECYGLPRPCEVKWNNNGKTKEAYGGIVVPKMDHTIAQLLVGNSCTIVR